MGRLRIHRYRIGEMDGALLNLIQYDQDVHQLDAARAEARRDARGVEQNDPQFRRRLRPPLRVAEMRRRAGDLQQCAEAEPLAASGEKKPAAPRGTTGSPDDELSKNGTIHKEGSV